MNIETADRLIKYRKKSGLSQDQVAEKIGVSRQAVSKWERAEASPDTDNLIMLSKIYNVSLDELINGKPFSYSDADNGNDSNNSEKNGSDNTSDADDSANADTSDENSGDNSANADDDEPKDHISFKNGIHIDSKDGDKVHIGLSGIHVHDKNGDKVDVGWNGIHIKEGKTDGDKVDVDLNGVFVEENGKKVVTTDENGDVIVDESVMQKHRKSKTYRFFKHFPYYALCVLAYIFFGFFNVCGGWGFGWMIFLTIPLYYSLVTAIHKRKAADFAYPVLVVLIYLFLGFWYSLWHPMWIVFLTIPLYYAICDFIKKMKN